MKNRFPVILLSALILTFTVIPSAYAQKTKIRIDGNIIKSYIEYMSTDEKLGRQTLTPGYEETAEWAAAKFKEWGLKPAGENGTYFQAVPIEGRRATFAWNIGRPEMTINGRKFYLNDRDFSLDQKSTPGTTVTGEIVFAGYGISAPHKGLDEYAEINVRGKVVLVFKGSPNDAPSSRSYFSPAQEKTDEEDWTDESTDNAKITTAYEKGAAAILFYNANPTSGGRGRGGAVEKSPFARDFLVFSNIDERVLRYILWQDPMESTGSFGKWLNIVIGDIKQKKAQSKNTGYTATLKGYDKTEFYGKEFGNNISRNVIAKIEGTDRRLKNQYVIMGGHMDHVGQREGLPVNGADDNASGTAVTMEIARLLAKNNFKPKRTIIFCCWCGEEMGLIGSYYFTDNPCDGVTMDNVVTYFNMDMVGLGDAIGAPGALNFPTIFDVIMRDQDMDIADSVQPRTGGPGGSDHSGFITKGIESLALMTRGGFGHPYYHDTMDELQFIDPEILRKTGQFVLQGTISLANETKVNLLIKNRQIIYDGLMMSVASLNPDLDMPGGWSILEIADNAELLNMIKDEIEEMRRPPRQMMNPYGGGGQQPRANPAVGINNLSIFDGNVALVETAAAALNFGRIDIKGNDGVWFENGLTSEGRAAIKAMEENNIAVNLVNPGKELLNDMLYIAERSFMISGFYQLDDAMIPRFNEKNVILAIEFNPINVNACVNSLEDAKKKFGDTDNLALFLTSTDNLDDGKKALYTALAKKGWTKDEIYAIAISGGGRRRGGVPPNISKLGR